MGRFDPPHPAGIPSVASLADGDQRSLRDALALYKSVLSSALDPIIVIDGRGIIQVASDSVERVFQWTPQELVGQDIAVLMPEPHRSNHGSYLARFMQTGETSILGSTRPFDAVRKDGTALPIDLSVSQVEGIETPIPLFTGIIHDRTGRQQQEERIRLLMNLALAVGGASDLTTAMAVTLEQICEATGWDYGEAWVPDSNNEVLEETPVWHARDAKFDKFQSMTQDTRFRRGEGLPGRVWDKREPEWLDDLTDEAVFRRAEQASKAGFRAAVAIPILSGSEVVAVLAFFVSAPRDRDRQLLELVTAAVAPLGAVIQRRRAEGARQESERRMREMLERVDLIAVMLDRTGHVTFCNDYLLKLSGWRYEDLIGRAWTAQFVPQEHRAEVASILDEACRTGNVRRHAENEIICRNGERRLIAWNNTVIRDNKGETLGVTGLGVDITDRRRAERELAVYQEDLEAIVQERTRELETSHEQLRVTERLASMGTLAAGLGHDMNNVLLPIRCHLEALEAQELTEPTRRRVEEIRGSIQYLQQLADGLHLLALNPDDPDASMETVDVPRWWDQYGSLLIKALPKRARIATSLPSDLPPVQMPPHRLMQALLNLLVNAGEAVDDGDGRIRVWAEAIDDRRLVRIAVGDNGAGMTAEVKRRALDPFFTTKTRGLGTGLGLPLVQGVVKAAGGSLRIDSEPGEGTTIELLIPAATDAADVTAAAEPPAALAAGISVADQRIASLIASMLGTDGFTARHVEPDDAGSSDLWITDALPDRREAVRDFVSHEGRAVITIGETPEDWIGPGVLTVNTPNDFEELRHRIAEAHAFLSRRRP
jgi:PAS domain S-box-containing protein